MKTIEEIIAWQDLTAHESKLVTLLYEDWQTLKSIVLAKCCDDVPDTMQYQCVNCCETFRKLSHAKGHAEICQ